MCGDFNCPGWSVERRCTLTFGAEPIPLRNTIMQQFPRNFKSIDQVSGKYPELEIVQDPADTTSESVIPIDTDDSDAYCSKLFFFFRMLLNFILQT